MQAKIIRSDGDLKREVWWFEFYASFGATTDFYFDSYLQQERPTKRHGWRTGNHWNRHERRHWMTLDAVPLPADVVQEAKDHFKAQIDQMEVTT